MFSCCGVLGIIGVEEISVMLSSMGSVVFVLCQSATVSHIEYPSLMLTPESEFWD